VCSDGARCILWAALLGAVRTGLISCLVSVPACFLQNGRRWRGCWYLGVFGTHCSALLTGQRWFEGWGSASVSELQPHVLDAGRGGGGTSEQKLPRGAGLCVLRFSAALLSVLQRAHTRGSLWEISLGQKTRFLLHLRRFCGCH